MPSSIQPEQFELIRLNDTEIIEFTRTQNGQAWKGALSIKDYVLREHVLGKSRMATTSPNQLLVFMLKRINDNTPLCSIELLIRKSKKYTHSNGDVANVDILSGCIGGVYTYPEHRGHGYARIMVDKLLIIAKEIIGHDGFIFLYSEIGEYYTKNGFKSFGVDLINVPMQGATIDPINEPKYEFINYHEFDSLMETFRQESEDEIISKVKQDKLTRICVEPNANILDWFHLRSKYISYKLFYENKDNSPIDFYTEPYQTITAKLSTIEPHKFGIKLYDNNRKVIAFIVWTMDYVNETNENYITVLKLVSFEGNDDENSIQLLKLLKNHLLTQPVLGMKTSKIVIWESEISTHVKQFLVNDWKSKAGIDNPSRSAVLMNNAEDDQELRRGNVIWEGNNKLPWF